MQQIKACDLLPIVFLNEHEEAGKANLLSLLRELLKEDYEKNASFYTQNPEYQHQKDLHQREFQQWSPSSHLLGSITKQGDRSSILHALAVLSFRRGYKNIVIFDGIARDRITTVINHHNEDSYRFVPIPTVIISIRPDPSSPNGLSLFAKRPVMNQYGKFMHYMPVLSNGEVLFNGDAQETQFHPLWRHEYTGEIQREQGTLLHDLDRPPFDQTHDILGWEKCRAAVSSSLRPSLPVELVDIITSCVREGRSGINPLWKRRPSRTHLIILLCYDATEAEVEETQSAIRRILPTLYLNEANLDEDYDLELRLMSDANVPFRFTAEVIPLNKHCCWSRRDLITFWETCNIWDPQFGVDLSNTPTLPLLFLPKPVADIEGACFSTLTHYASRGNLALVADLSLHSICRSMTDIGRVDVSRPGRPQPTPGRGSSFIDINDGVRKPRESFWYPVMEIRHHDPGICDAFFLTDDITQEDKERLRREIEVASLDFFEDALSHSLYAEHENFYASVVRQLSFSFTPWDEIKTNRKVGTIMDVWETVFESFTERYVPPAFLIFLDQQSVLDNTVLLVKPNHYRGTLEHELLNDIQCPRLRGMQGVRLPANYLHCYFMAERERTPWGPLRDLNMEEQVFRRPGWPTERAFLDE